MNTAIESVVPAAGESPPPTSRPERRWWRWWYAVPIVLIALAGLGAGLVTIPYYALAPGSVVSTNAIVVVPEGSSYPPEGEIFLATVSLRRVTLLEALQGWLDPHVDVVERDVILPPRVPSAELREFNLQLMTDSQQLAVAVALQQLGHDVVSGSGAQVVQVLDGTPAAGVLEPGDTIVAVGGEPVQADFQAADLLGSRSPGDRVDLVVRAANGDERAVEVVLAENPDRPGRALLGVTLQTADLELDLPIDVEFRVERIGGPSAGLAFTLQVLDQLTEGELTGGHLVAATGTIGLDGSVGPVGGVAQKTVAVRREKVDLFLVPSSEVQQARRVAGDGLRIEPVDTLEDALRILDSVGGNGLALDGGTKRA